VRLTMVRRTELARTGVVDPTSGAITLDSGREILLVAGLTRPPEAQHTLHLRADLDEETWPPGDYSSTRAKVSGVSPCSAITSSRTGRRRAWPWQTQYR
jgi:hypothetical protein